MASAIYSLVQTLGLSSFYHTLEYFFSFFVYSVKFSRDFFFSSLITIFLVCNFCLLPYRVQRHPFERIATPFQVYSWTAPQVEHAMDCVRAEDAYTSRLGYEEHIPGQVGFSLNILCFWPQYHTLVLFIHSFHCFRPEIGMKNCRQQENCLVKIYQKGFCERELYSR